MLGRLLNHKKKIFALGVVVCILVIVLMNVTVTRNTKSKTFDDIRETPVNYAGLLLGTSKYVESGNINEYYQNRITAAVDLYTSQKISHIVISGDNAHENYNEPQSMKEDLMLKGVLESDLTLDYAGFRTYDSVYRMSEIFSQEKFTVISQKFHNERAIFIAKKLGLDAIGYNAKDVTLYGGIKTKLREKLARVKMFLDFIGDKEPKYLGEKVEI